MCSSQHDSRNLTSISPLAEKGKHKSLHENRSQEKAAKIPHALRPSILQIRRRQLAATTAIRPAFLHFLKRNPSTLILLNLLLHLPHLLFQLPTSTPHLPRL